MTRTGATGRPLVGGDDGQLPDPAGRAGPRRRARGLGRRRPRVHRPARRHRHRRSSATRTRRSSRRSRRRRPRSATSPTWPCTSRGSPLAERLLELAGRPGRVFFCNSGAEANEAAFKISRLHRPARGGHRRGLLPRPHDGRARADRPARQGRAPFAPLPGGVGTCPYGDAAGAGAAVGDATAMVLLEPMLGEAGVVPAPAGYLAAAARARGAARRAARRRRGADRHRPHRALVRPPGRRRRSPTSSPSPRALGGGLPIGALPRLRRRGRRC